MLTDLRLKNLKPKERLYKVADRHGLYAAVLPSGGISFRFNYRGNGRQETVTLGRYGAGGMTLAEARSALAEARKTLTSGESPARTKNERIQRKKAEETFFGLSRALAGEVQNGGVDPRHAALDV